MIGMELLNLMYGNPLNQIAQATNPAPNPNPNAPPRPAAPPMQNQAPPGAGHYEALPDRVGSPHWVPGPAPGPGGGVVTPATPAEQRGAQVSPGTPGMPAGGPSPQGGAPAPAGPPPPASVAPQSPPDLAQLYLQMEQRNRSANEIDHGLALMASAYAAPGTQGQIMHSMDNQGQDPGAQLGNLIQLQNMQRLQNMPAPGSGQGGTGGIDPSVWAMLPPDAKLKYIEAQGQSGLAIAQQGAEQKQKDLLDAQQKAPSSLQQMNDMDTVANQLKGPMNSALTSIVSSPTARIAAEKLMETDPAKEPWDSTKNLVYANMLTSDQLAALNQLKKLDAQIYGDAFQSTGSRRTQQEVGNLKNGISTLTNFNQSPEAYMSQFNDFQNQLHKTIANTYGAAGRVDEIPDAMKWDMSNPNAPKPLVDSAYLPNGDKYGGSGGQWASSPPKANFDYAAIPSGTVYTAPDGTQRRKP